MNSTPLLYVSMSAIALVLVLPLSAQTLLASAVRFNIDAGKAEETLREFGTQAGEEVLFESKDVQGCETPPIHVDLTPPDVLKKMLARCPLKYSYVNPWTVAVERIQALCRVSRRKRDEP